MKGMNSVDCILRSHTVGGQDGCEVGLPRADGRGTVDPRGIRVDRVIKVIRVEGVVMFMFQLDSEFGFEDDLWVRLHKKHM